MTWDMHKTLALCKSCLPEASGLWMRCIGMQTKGRTRKGKPCRARSTTESVIHAHSWAHSPPLRLSPGSWTRPSQQCLTDAAEPPSPWRLQGPAGNESIQQDPFPHCTPEAENCYQFACKARARTLQNLKRQSTIHPQLKHNLFPRHHWQACNHAFSGDHALRYPSAIGIRQIEAEQ